MNLTIIFVIFIIIAIAVVLLVLLSRKKSSSTDTTNNNNIQKEYFVDLCNILKEVDFNNIYDNTQFNNFYNNLFTQLAKDICNKDLKNFTVKNFGNDLDTTLLNQYIIMKLIITSNLPLYIKKDRISCLYLFGFGLISIKSVNKNNTITLADYLEDNNLSGKTFSYSDFKDLIYDLIIKYNEPSIPSEKLTTSYACSNIFD